MTVRLTDRERAVLRGIVADLTYPEIGDSLKLGYETIKTYAKRLRKKLGKRTKTGLALWAKANPTKVKECQPSAHSRSSAASQNGTPTEKKPAKLKTCTA